ncbi:LuxR C-terminal-related transcriptional regulator [Egicoccus sp. AB-alg2]|uniref:LuxR C-terminal-related transcriptional regulator n=1 Tax=Egicoccus sp. AB-alg2 TaxID=3242693 RepID=UPI00359E8A26
MTSTDVLVAARASMARRRWSVAYAEFLAADHEKSLAAEDRELLASAAHLIGEDRVCADSWERAHHDHLAAGDVAAAARCAFWLSFGLLNRGETARGAGWLARARRLLDDHDLDVVTRGYLRVPDGLHALEAEGDVARAGGAFREATAYGERFGDADLVAMGRLGQGQAMIRGGQIVEGVGLLDEVMVAVTAEELSPIVAGTVYCAVILACRDLFDLRRAHEWTEALDDWCRSQPGLVAFRGQCLVHRSEILQFHGLWTEAWEEARRARDRLTTPFGQPAVGMAHYQLAELLRLRGRFSEAERAYRRAREAGHDPYPGLALLRLAQGRVEEAAGAVGHALHAATDRLARAKMLAAQVEIMLAAGDLDRAREGVDELDESAAALGAPLLQAMAAQARGAVALASGRAEEAVEAFRDACRRWQRLEAPYEHARTRVGLGLACRALGDEETAALELHVGRDALDELGAGPDAERATRLLGASAGIGHRLTSRQREVLALVAAGHTNPEIAAALVVSEHTVRRHLQDIFARLGVTSRAAAAVYAVEHGLL